MSYQPPFPTGGQPPRSTPISGEMFQAPPSAGAPPTPGQYLGTQAPQPQMPQMPQMPQGMPTIAFPSRPSRGWLGWLITLIILGGVGIGSWAIYKAVSKAANVANDAVNNANEVSDPHLSTNDRSALGLTGNEQFLYDGAAMAAVTTVLDNGIAGQPTAFTQIGLYSDYAIATAQNPTLPDHLDQYTWRTGKLGSGSPQSNDAEAPTKVFTIDQVQWAAVSAVVANAVPLSKVEEGEISYVLISRDSFTDGAPVVVRIYVNGPRASAYIQVAADGTVISVV
ncbi:MAG: hypothetical protein WCC60_05290 [Ilumatobacteraceae bacterium]